MMKLRLLTVLSILRFSCLATATSESPHLGDPTHGGWWSSYWQQRGRDSQRAEAVREAFEFAWAGYSEYAFPNDQLEPANNGYNDPRNGWGASAIDALSTAIVMEIPSIVNQVLAYVPTVNFAMSYENEAVSLFETTIRYLGGMLSGYDLLSGPLVHLANDTSNVHALLTQAETLANILSFAFDTPTGIPSNNLFINNRSTDGAQTNGLATIGTLVLEWTHLSDLTGNTSYAELSQKGESYLLNPKPPNHQPWPGLVGSNVNIGTGLFTDASGGWIVGHDSFYEYLLKMYVYDNTRFSSYRDRWILAADSSIAHLVSHPSSRPDLTFLATFAGTQTGNFSQHLACFDGGNFLLGGSVLGRQDYIDFGLQLVAGCHDTYASTLTHIGPESFSWNTTLLATKYTDQMAFYELNGFYIIDPSYILRPEVIESYYYAYRITRNSMYQDWAWDAFVAINATTRVGSGFSEIENVNVLNGGRIFNQEDSFLFAEVMKYSYLIQAPDAPWNVDYHGKNEWVFNTEGHPFKTRGTPLPA